MKDSPFTVHTRDIRWRTGSIQRVLQRYKLKQIGRYHDDIIIRQLEGLYKQDGRSEGNVSRETFWSNRLAFNIVLQDFKASLSLSYSMLTAGTFS